MKKAISLILIIATLFATLLTPAQAAQADQISPQYVTSDNAYTNLTISTTGEVQVVVKLTGMSDVAEISVTTYLEKKIGNTWYRALVNPWTYSTTNSYCATSFTGNISNSGTYRARSTFTVTGSTIETITVTSESTYDAA